MSKKSSDGGPAGIDGVLPFSDAHGINGSSDEPQLTGKGPKFPETDPEQERARQQWLAQGEVLDPDDSAAVAVIGFGR